MDRNLKKTAMWFKLPFIMTLFNSATMVRFILWGCKIAIGPIELENWDKTLHLSTTYMYINTHSEQERERSERGTKRVCESARELERERGGRDRVREGGGKGRGTIAHTHTHTAPTITHTHTHTHTPYTHAHRDTPHTHAHRDTPHTHARTHTQALNKPMTHCLCFTEDFKKLSKGKYTHELLGGGPSLPVFVFFLIFFSSRTYLSRTFFHFLEQTSGEPPTLSEIHFHAFSLALESL